MQLSPHMGDVMPRHVCSPKRKAQASYEASYASYETSYDVKYTEGQTVHHTTGAVTTSYHADPYLWRCSDGAAHERYNIVGTLTYPLILQWI